MEFETTALCPSEEGKMIEEPCPSWSGEPSPSATRANIRAATTSTTREVLWMNGGPCNLDLTPEDDRRLSDELFEAASQPPCDY